MNAGWEKKEVLMVVKTYPTPSTTYKETVCTAGITKEGKWIRLYPIRYRFLQDDQQFKTFTWIEVDTKKPTNDNRPESFKVNGESIKILRYLSPSKGLEERKKYLLPLVKSSLEEITAQSEKDETSLGIFKPKQVDDLIIEPTEKEWNQQQLLNLSQMSFFDNDNTKKVLEKIPYDFRFKFTCNDRNCKGHNMKMTAWEIYQTFRSFRSKYASEKIALDKLKETFMNKFTNPKLDSYFITGTVHRYKKFILIGYFTCPHEEYKQLSFL